MGQERRSRLDSQAVGSTVANNTDQRGDLIYHRNPIHLNNVGLICECVRDLITGGPVRSDRLV